MNAKLIGKYILVALFGIPTLLSLYLFFGLLLRYWLPDIVAIVPALVATYLLTVALLRSKMSGMHKALTAAVVTVTVVGLTVKLLEYQIAISRLNLIVDELR